MLFQLFQLFNQLTLNLAIQGLHILIKLGSGKDCIVIL